MPEPLISIVIPAYKAERFIRETLDSIATQTFTSWEAIVIEDGTHDGTEAIVQDFARTVSQPVIFLRHEVNQGLPATRNTGIAKARGEWIALLDSDDIWAPDHLEKAISAARDSGADLVHSSVMMFDSDTGKDEKVRAPTPEAKAAFPQSVYLARYTIQPSASVFRRDICQKVGGFDPACRYVEDREFWLRLIRAGAKIRHVDAVTCRYRQHAVAMTKNAAAMAEGVAYVYEKNADWEGIPLAARKDYCSSAWFSAGRILLRSNPAKARAHLGRALRHRPCSPRLISYWCAAALLSLLKPKSA